MSITKPLIILDGGMSRELIRLNAPFQQPEWSAYALINAPHLVQQVHSEFAASGADVLTTNSYALVPFHIGEERFQQRGEELAALSGRLARAAADEEYRRSGRKVLVAGSLPPIFGSYEPDRFDSSRVHEYLHVLVKGLSPYVDIWLGETLSLVAEAEAVQTAVKDTGKPFWIAFTLEDEKDSPIPSLRSGETVVDAARWILNSSAESLLFNCSRPEVMSNAIRDALTTIKNSTREITIGVYANAFMSDSDSGAANEGVSRTREDLDIKSYFQFAQDWVSNGAKIIGGCCGIGCEHIKHLAQDLKDYKSNN